MNYGTLIYNKIKMKMICFIYLILLLFLSSFLFRKCGIFKNVLLYFWFVIFPQIKAMFMRVIFENYLFH